MVEEKSPFAYTESTKLISPVHNYDSRDSLVISGLHEGVSGTRSAGAGTETVLATAGSK